MFECRWFFKDTSDVTVATVRGGELKPTGQSMGPGAVIK